MSRFSVKGKKGLILALGALAVVVLVVFSAVPMIDSASTVGLVSQQSRTKVSTTITLSPASTEVQLNNSIHVDGVLMGSVAIAGVKVKVQMTCPNGSLAYPTQGSTAVTDRSGRFSLDYKPTVAGTYKLTATYSGSSKYGGCSASMSFTALPADQPTKASSFLALTLADPDVQVGDNVAATAVLKKYLSTGTTPIAGATVSVNVIGPDGTTSSPSEGSQAVTCTNGTIVADYVPSTAGTYQIEVSYAGDSTVNGTVSTASFTASDPEIVRTATSMTLSLSSASVQTGSSMHATGTLTGRSALSGATVTLQVVRPDGSNAYPVQGASTVTDGNGKFVMDYAPATAGTYKFIATYAGSSTNLGSMVSASFAAEAPTTDVSAKIMVYPSGSTYNVKNVETGKTVYSGTDLASAMKAAFNALTPSRTVKEAVLLKGDFTWPGEMSLPSYTILMLDGTVTVSSAASSDMILYTKGQSNIEVTGGLWIAGSSCTDPCMFFASCTNVNVHDVKVNGNGGRGGIGIMNCGNVVMAHNDLYNAVSAPLYVTSGCHDVEIAYNTVTDSAYSGITLITPDGNVETIQRVSIHDNTVVRTQYEGIALYPDGLEDTFSNITVDSNVMVDCGHGGYPMIAVMAGWYNSAGKNGQIYDCVVSNNICRVTDGKQHGGEIYVGGHGHHVYGNKCYNSTYSAIALIEAYDCVVENNLVDTTTLANAYGILFEGSCNNIVRNNQVKNANGQGIMLEGDSDDSSSHNTISGNTITAAKVTGSRGCCIWVSGPSTLKDGTTEAQSGNQILSNTLVTTGTDYSTGIYDRGTGTVISGNTVVR